MQKRNTDTPSQAQGVALSWLNQTASPDPQNASLSMSGKSPAQVQAQTQMPTQPNVPTSPPLLSAKPETGSGSISSPASVVPQIASSSASASSSSSSCSSSSPAEAMILARAGSMGTGAGGLQSVAEGKAGAGERKSHQRMDSIVVQQKVRVCVREKEDKTKRIDTGRISNTDIAMSLCVSVCLTLQKHPLVLFRPPLSAVAIPKEACQCDKFDPIGVAIHAYVTFLLLFVPSLTTTVPPARTLLFF